MRDSWHERGFSERWYFSDLSEWWCDSGWSSVIGDECRFITGFPCAVSTQLADDLQKYEDNCNCPNSSASDSCSIRVAGGGSGAEQIITRIGCLTCAKLLLFTKTSCDELTHQRRIAGPAQWDQ